MTDLQTIDELQARLGVSRTTLWELTKQPDFPQPICITARRKAFIVAEIDAWIEKRAAERDRASR